ncbi:hypothetical protein CkaCkLH20_01930 [Colletotrichum karsti]|uniref:Transmembrane protein 234-like protein n=1 Tax=Colletotrichum karsti TaxID=1095194 RepID=A0A9P6LPA7_9PEZI|nr:uncharacterized protein CkaCkLH20_01930 [Colletotrichum karsti]KAF9880888.1 hypothetical protein CkaCkLH20_01930 [Colletotrichum karsti]
MTSPDDADARPAAINYVAGFLLVGLAWGFTTPFIRRAAKDHNPSPHPVLESEAVRASWVKSRLYGAFFGVVDLLRNPRYAVPLLINLTGSVWFFLLIGQAGMYLPCLSLMSRAENMGNAWVISLTHHPAELSLTVPIVNTLAFLFTVIGEWWVEKKVISRDTMLGMVLSLSGIALCVHSKTKY